LRLHHDRSPRNATGYSERRERMNKHNLIRLDAFLQAEFQMLPHFRIMEMSTDNQNKVVLNGYPRENEMLELQKIGMTDNFETIWAAYSKQQNILVIKEPRLA